MSTSIPTPDRRHAERTQLSHLAYIHIEPDNGAIVLNVSADGLRFHSMAPVERNGAFRFSLLEQSRRISAGGELAWIDDTKKIGGVKFTTLTTEAHEQIHSWMEPVPDDGPKASTLGSAFLKTFPRLETLRFHKKAQSADFGISASTRLNPKVRVKLSGFSGGLATGLLISLIATAGLLGAHMHRTQLGESLINLGERLAPNPSARPQLAPPSPAVVSQLREPAMPVAESPFHQQVPVNNQEAVLFSNSTTKDSHLPRMQVRAEPKERPVVQPLRSELKQPQIQPKLPVPDVIQVHPQPAAPQPAIGTPVQAESTASPVISLPQSSPPLADVIATKPVSPFPTALTSSLPAPTLLSQVAPSSSQQISPLPFMYFDLGKFKDELFAQSIRDKVAKLGLRANLIQKGHLWMNSFQVLVGPYSQEDEARRVHRELLSQGYKPRPFERGSRNISLISALTLNGTRLPIGDVAINWESYVASANVNFSYRDSWLTKADGRWVRCPFRYQNDEYVYRKAPNGSRILLEIHFRGMDRALVFRAGS